MACTGLTETLDVCLAVFIGMWRLGESFSDGTSGRWQRHKCWLMAATSELFLGPTVSSPRSSVSSSSYLGRNMIDCCYS